MKETNRNFIRLSDLTEEDVKNIFQIADSLQEGKYENALKGKTIVMFFPASSIRTRVTFEKGIYLLGGQSILFEPATLDKKEDIGDVIGYLNNWADGLVVRYPDISMLDKIEEYARMPVINAMTDVNHPCEMLADLYALSKRRADYTKAGYLFVGAAGNIGYAWKEASELFGFSLEQCCPAKYKMENVPWHDSILEAARGKDIICTDSLSGDKLPDFAGYQVTSEVMEEAAENALLNPCPPFFRGEEVSAEVIESNYFVGYDFKEYLLQIQQAILIYTVQNR